MLGYELKDLNKMVTAVDSAYEYVTTPDVLEGLELARDFLQGLWAEGYFD
jgi:hypothetical protein